MREHVGAEVRGHDQQRVAEVDRSPLPVGQAAVVQHLQQHVEHVRVGLFHLVEQHDLIGPAPHGFGQRSAFVIADIAGRGADHPADRVLFHVLAHVEASDRRVVVEQEFGERLGQLGLANAGGA